MRRTRTVFAAVAVAILIAALLSPAGAGPIDGTYTASVSPSTVVAGTTRSLTYKITNNAPLGSVTVLTDATIKLGGFNGDAVEIIAAPDAQTCDASLDDNLVTISCRPGIAPLFSVSVEVTGTVGSVPGPYTQETTASSGFTGLTAEGNDPVLTVVDVLLPCGAGDSCTSTVNKQTTENMSVTMTVPSGLHAVEYDLSVGGKFTGPSCDSFTPHGKTIRSNVSGTAVTGRGHTIDLTLYKVRPHLIQNGVDQWDICFASTTVGWTTADGSPAIDTNNDGLYEGVLPMCGTPRVAPCLVFKKRNSGNVVMRYVAPAGDPLSIPGVEL